MTQAISQVCGYLPSPYDYTCSTLISWYGPSLIKMMEDKNMTMEDLSEEQRATLERELPSKYYEYNLRGCVIHIGTAEQGHYISYIQDRES